MFISRFLLVAVLAYLFNLLMVKCAPHLPSPSSSSSSSSLSSSSLAIHRKYKLFHLCSGGVVEIRNKKIVAINYALRTKYAQLDVITAGNQSEIMIFGPHADRYLCFNRKGKLIARHRYLPDYCKFRETMRENHYNELELVSKPSWRIGFNRKGHALNSAKYSKKENCFSFMSTAGRFEGGSAEVDSGPSEGPHRIVPMSMSNGAAGRGAAHRTFPVQHRSKHKKRPKQK